MGSSSSKAAKTASKIPATSTGRIYPTRSPPVSSSKLTSSKTNAQSGTPASEAALGPTVHPKTHTAESKDQAITLDASDPDIALNTRLRAIGPVQPNPTRSNSSTFNAPSPPSSHDKPKTQFSSQFQPSPSNPAQTVYPTSHTGSGPNALQNPAVSLLTARYRLAEEAEAEFAGIGRASSKGRQFLDVVTIRQILVMREKGGPGIEREIENSLGLREGVVGRLGRMGVVEPSGN